MQQLAVMSVNDNDNKLAPKSQRTMTLLSMFLGSKSMRYAHNLMAQRQLDEDALSQWHTALLPFAYTIGKLMYPFCLHVFRYCTNISCYLN
jgi:hypothetical protein